MLFPADLLPGIEKGEITLTFRPWKTPRAKVGTRHRLPVGEIVIDEVTVVKAAEISDDEARRAGFARADEVRAWLARGSGDGDVYRVAFHFAGPDRRVELRERDALTDEEVAELRRRLDRMGDWARETLDLIRRRPGTRAADLAAELGRERLPFKADVRKLKELGLTESLTTGYRLSPRGEAFLQRQR